MSAYVSGDLAFELVDPASELAHAPHKLNGDAHACGLLEGAEPTSDALECACAVDVAAGGDAGLKLGAQIDEVPAQPVDDAGALGDEVLAVVTQQPGSVALVRRETLSGTV